MALAVVLGALVALVVVQEPAPPDWRIVALLAALAVLGEWNRLSMRNQTVISLTSIMLAASIPLTGPLGATIVGAAAHGLVPVHRHGVARAFNTVMTGLLGVFGGIVYLGLNGHLLAVRVVSVLDLLFRCLVPLMAATLVIFLVNLSCVSGMISLTTGESLWQALRGMISSTWVSYLGYALVGFLFAVLWGPGGLELVTVLVMIAPLLLAQWSLTQQYAEREAHRRTIAGLVAAVETRDPIMRGHSARVAAVTALIGDALRLSPRRAEALQSAALLHDIGLVGPRPRSAPSSTRLSAAEYERIRRHPERGVDMLQHIDFLSEALVAIRHHHERWDGHGFPDGLAGDQIPLMARIIAVADAYCALTTPRLDREALTTLEALKELRARAGRQLDPACVDALRRGTRRLEQLTEKMLDEDTSRASGLDHDLPAISDQMAFGQEVRP